MVNKEACKGHPARTDVVEASRGKVKFGFGCAMKLLSLKCASHGMKENRKRKFSLFLAFGGTDRQTDQQTDTRTTEGRTATSLTSFLGGRVGGGGCEVSEKRLWCEGGGAPCCSRGEGARKGELGSDAPRIRWAWSCCRCVAAPTPGCIPSAGEMAPAAEGKETVLLRMKEL